MKKIGLLQFYNESILILTLPNFLLYAAACTIVRIELAIFPPLPIIELIHPSGTNT